METVPLHLRKFMAPEYVFGAGSAGLIGQSVRNLGGRRALLVLDPGVLAHGLHRSALASLVEAGVEAVLFSATSSNPREGEIMAGAEVYREKGCDCLVAVGGGSPMDCAKGIGIVSANDRHILAFEGVDNVSRPGPPLVCIPTTSGTGAEVSQFAIVNDTGRRVKIAIVSRTLVPDLALLDPGLTLSMPPDLTAHTGFDALSHAVEAYLSNAASPTTDLFALEAIRLIQSNLVSAIRCPEDPGARAGMLRASLYAGMAFSNAILGAVHAMAHSLGGFLDLPHGLCNAVLLDHVLVYNRRVAPDRCADIARALGVDDSKEDALTDRIRTLKEQAGIRESLQSMGVRREDLDELTRKAMEDPCLLTNPGQPTFEDIRGLYELAF
ncbi:MAG TPA: alcohol dehydrogenase-like regulatory protein ErcA [Desulfomicrobiaceae bacterium]|nr:alcohol dehydrogenase-like regulatory protein ErcA [Desulfomicrobiaceae bacterium]